MRSNIALFIFVALMISACTPQEIFNKGTVVLGQIMKSPNNPCQLIVNIGEVSVHPNIVRGTSFSVTIDKCEAK